MSLYPGAPYNYSAAAQGLVFTAGACPLDEHGTVVAPGDFEAHAAALSARTAAIADRYPLYEWLSAQAAGAAA